MRPSGRSRISRASPSREAPAREVRALGLDVERDDHPGLPEMPHRGVCGERRGELAPALRLGAVGGDHVVVAEEVEHGERRAARERVARVRVRVQERARDVVAVEGVVHFVRREHAGERQVAAAQTFRQAQEIGRRRVGLLPGEQGAGPAEAGHDLVGDQQHLVARADLAGARQVVRVVHRHAGRALHARLDDQRSGRRVMEGEMRVERTCRPLRDVARRLARRCRACIRARHRRTGTQERQVGVAEERHVGHRERADRLAVVAAGETHEPGLRGPAAVLPVVERHLERDLDRGRAVAGVERVP